jgi:hypothetical protein
MISGIPGLAQEAGHKDDGHHGNYVKFSSIKGKFDAVLGSRTPFCILHASARIKKCKLCQLVTMPSGVTDLQLAVPGGDRAWSRDAAQNARDR